MTQLDDVHPQPGKDCPRQPGAHSTLRCVCVHVGCARWARLWDSGSLALLPSPRATLPLVWKGPWGQSTDSCWEKGLKETSWPTACLPLLHSGPTSVRISGTPGNKKGHLHSLFLEGEGPCCISPMPRPPPLPGLPWGGAGGTERIQLDGSGAGADGQEVQRGAVAEGAGLVWEAMLHRLQ